MQVLPYVDRPVPQGPRAYRTRLRSLGPLAALLPAAVIGGAAVLALHGSSSVGRGATGFALAVFAAPLLLAFGGPLTSGTAMFASAVGASAVLWFVIGVVASRRATRSPVATWRDFWREFAWPAVGVWIGVVAALGVADLVIGRALF
ncbi:MAG: hypothetical protein ABIQ39_04355 [Ilumatobacteraceae bacterium]